MVFLSININMLKIVLILPKFKVLAHIILLLSSMLNSILMMGMFLMTQLIFKEWMGDSTT
jgi:hypothetical protein